MKSSEEAADLNTTETQSLLTIQHPLYALLAVYIPLSILAGLLPSVNFILGLFLDSVPVNIWFFFGFMSGTIASIYWAIIKRSKADHTAANIRGAIIILALIYCIGSLMRSGRPLGERFIPGFENLPSCLFAFIIWFTVLAIKRIFEEQELLDSHTRIYDGEKLRQIMLEDSGLMSEADIDMRKLIARYRILFLLPFALFVLCGFLGMQLSVTFAAALSFLFLAGIFIIAFLTFLRREYAYAAEGLVFSGRPRALLAGVIVILASAALGLLLSSRNSLLSFDIIANLFRRLLAFLAGLFTGEPVELPPRVEEELTRQPSSGGMPQEFLEMMGESTPSRFWDYVTYGALGFVIFLFIAFMINPLLNRSHLFRDAGTWPKRIAAFLRAWFKAFGLGFRWFFNSLREGSGGRRIQDSEVLRKIEEGILDGYSAAKRRDMRRSVGLFARLIYWGTEVLRISWKPTHAPLDYCALLTAAIDNEAGHHSGIIHGIARSGALFDKALYAAEPLTHEERDEFKALVEMVTDSSPV